MWTETTCGVVLYTQLPAVSDASERDVGFLLWRDLRPTKLQSATFFHEFVVEALETEDYDIFSSVLTVLAKKLHGKFFRRPQDKTIQDAVQSMRKRFSKRLQRQNNGVFVLQRSSFFPLYFLPVPFVSHEELAATSTAGCARWVSLSELVKQLRDPDSSSNSFRVRAFNEFNPAGQGGETITLYLTFVETLRSSMRIIQSHLKQVLPILKLEEVYDFALETETLASDNTPQTPRPSSERFCCRKCGSTLFVKESLILHQRGAGSQAFSWKQRRHEYLTVEKTVEEQSKICSDSFFIDIDFHQFGPLQNVNDRLYCPKCRFVVGKYNLSGLQCTCGRWISPAVQIPKSKVDRKHMKGALAKVIVSRHTNKSKA